MLFGLASIGISLMEGSNVSKQTSGYGVVLQIDFMYL